MQFKNAETLANMYQNWRGSKTACPNSIRATSCKENVRKAHHHKLSVELNWYIPTKNRQAKQCSRKHYAAHSSSMSL